MDQLHISALHPALPAPESIQFRAAVTLIWPYSSSARQCALLLAEPDFRLRRKKGQVRARFSGSSAKAIATTGVGIGDEVVLSLRGAQFVQEGAVSTPGKSIDWELLYAQTVVVKVFRNDTEIANLDIIDVAPTPAPRSPKSQTSIARPSPSTQWSSPAFLKRVRLSDGPFFEAPYDPLVDETAERHYKKRRKSYRDWKAWTYSARTPSPEKEDADVQDGLGFLDLSPSRAMQLPHTPASPVGDVSSPLGGAEENQANANVRQSHQNTEQHRTSDIPTTRSERDDIKLFAEHGDSHTVSEDFALSDAQYAFGGDTEVDTEVNTEAEDTDQPRQDAPSASTTEADTEEHEDELFLQNEDNVTDLVSIASKQENGKEQADIRSQQGDSIDAVAEENQPSSSVSGFLQEDDFRTDNANLNMEFLDESSDALRMTMPPPHPPYLQTDFLEPVTVGISTPIGREPASPILQPLDSATLPFPSPFPGEREGNMTSYLDDVSNVQLTAVPSAETGYQQESLDSAGYILESSFFSSIGSSRASGVHPEHESAFTPVRFTFGLDGAGWSRPMQLSSSPVVEATPSNSDAHGQHDEARLSYSMGMTTSLTDGTTATMMPKGVIDVDVDLSQKRDAIQASLEPAAAEPGASQIQEEEALPNVYEDSAQVAEASASMAEATHSVEVSDEDARETADADPKGHEDLPQQDVNNSDSAPHLTAASEVIDPGLLPEDTKEGGQIMPEAQLIEDPELTPELQEPTALDGGHIYFEDADSHSEFVNLDSELELSTSNSFIEEPTSTQTQAQQEMEPVSGFPDMRQTFMVDKVLPLMNFDDTDQKIKDDLLLDHRSSEVMDTYPDIKMESVEEESMMITDSNHTPQVLMEASAELLIEVPEDGHRLGEMRTISVPATSPASNTRSKTKPTASPNREGSPTHEHAAQFTRSRTSFNSVARLTISPSRTRARSTASPAQGATPTSPYSLRSQTGLLSPLTNALPNAAARLSPRKHASPRSVGSVSEAGQSQNEPLDPSMSSFEPSQEVGSSRNRYPNVLFVKDSEEESLKSEHSMSTLQYSDDWRGTTMHNRLSEPPGHNARDDDPSHLKPPPASAPEPKTRTGVRISRKAPGQPEFIELLSSSPDRSLPSLDSAVVASSSPSRVHEHLPPPGSTDRPAKDLESEFPRFLSPSHAMDVEESMRSSPPVIGKTVSPSDQQSVVANNKLITPKHTQQVDMDLQTDFTFGQRGQDALLTPELTQATSAGLRISVVDDDNTENMPVVARNLSSSPVMKSTSQDPISDAGSDTTPNLPSIGLSTPLAYYTPLRDLIYFLNRSSQFHSSSHPDTLALVTQSTTPPKRAKKGPKHWTTTLHITDVSTYPDITTVNIFRAYQTALPVTDAGDVILLRGFAVKSLNRKPSLVSADESSWCVWRYGRPCWSRKKGAFGEVRAREEIKGPSVERGEGEWREVEKLRAWFVGIVRKDLEDRGGAGDKLVGDEGGDGDEEEEVT